MPRIGMLLVILLASACAEVRPRETPTPPPGAPPGAPGPGIGGGTSIAPPLLYQGRHN